MPYKYETTNMTMSKPLKRSAKLTNEDREEIRKLYALGGWSYRTLGIEFKVSKSSILFIIKPDKQKANYSKRVERGGSKQYYNKDAHAITMKEHRQYKKKLYDEGKLNDKTN